jgi:hypothetical protein
VKILRKLLNCVVVGKLIKEKVIMNYQALDYILDLVESQMKLDGLGIRANGDLCFASGGNWNVKANEFNDYVLMPDFESNEVCSYDEMEQRISCLIRELLY